MKTAKPGSNRDKIILAAADLFLTQGIRNTSMDTIVQVCGVAKSNIYYHFKSKDEVILAVAEWHMAWFRSHILALISNEPPERPALAALESYFQSLAEYIHSCEGERGCPFASLVVQASQTHEEVRLRISGFFLEARDELRQLLQEGIARGEIKSSVDPAGMAGFIVSLTEGAMLVAQAHRDAAVILEAWEQLRFLLGACESNG